MRGCGLGSEEQRASCRGLLAGVGFVGAEEREEKRVVGGGMREKEKGRDEGKKKKKKKNGRERRNGSCFLGFKKNLEFTPFT